MVVVCKKKKKPHPAWVFLRKMPEKQLILFAWPYTSICKNLFLCLAISLKSVLKKKPQKNIFQTEYFKHAEKTAKKVWASLSVKWNFFKHEMEIGQI